MRALEEYNEETGEWCEVEPIMRALEEYKEETGEWYEVGPFMRALEEYNEETGEYCETEPFMFTRVVLMFHIERRNSLAKLGPD
jgi:hypothetical protein